MIIKPFYEVTIKFLTDSSPIMISDKKQWVHDFYLDEFIERFCDEHPQDVQVIVE